VSIFRRDPAAPGANVGRARAREIGSPRVQLERAVTRFNASDAARTVAGLTRSLGPARISIGAAAGSPSEVRITVAWELCWYQWRVDVGEDGRAVFQIGRGSEIDQLDRSARHWNASCGDRGELALGVPVG
jgi:hypothetical protein